MKYYVRTTGERELDKTFSQIPYQLLIDDQHQFINILADQLLSISDDDAILLEDDIILCRNFKERIESVILERPSEIINFFTWPHEYFLSEHKKFFSYNQCTYFPKEKLQLLGSYIKEHFNELTTQAHKMKKVPTVEYLIRHSMQSLGELNYVYRPCLVQHLDTGSLINHDLPEMRRTPYFIDYLEDLKLSYTDCADPEIQQQLYDYMCEQFDEIDKYYQIFKYSSTDIESLIVGYGTVGKNLHEELKALKPDIYDKYKTEYNTRRHIKYDFCFICVDTPYNKDNPCDISQVEAALQENDAYIYIIKSTILPGTTDMLKQKYHKRIVFSPEYYGGTQHCNNFDFNFTILGGTEYDCIPVQQLLQKIYDARHVFRIVSPAMAELAKYMENSYLGMKVAFCNQFFRIAESYGVNYEQLRELFILDERVNPSHTFVYRDKPYYDTHCLNKDIPAITEAAPCNTQLLQSVIDYNEFCKKNLK